MLLIIGSLIVVAVLSVRLWNSLPDLIRTNPVTVYRGANQAVVSAQAPPHHPPHHPPHLHAFLQFERRLHVFSSLTMRLIDEIVVPTMRLIASARNLVAYARELQSFFSTSRLEDYAAPLRTRLRHGAAQISALRNMYTPATAVQGITYQRLCPTSFLLGLFVALVFVSSTPAGAADWLISGGLLLLVAYSLGGSELERDNEGEGDDALFDPEEYPMVDINLAPMIEQS